LVAATASREASACRFGAAACATRSAGNEQNKISKRAKSKRGEAEGETRIESNTVAIGKAEVAKN
jgi:hypothetical protein